LALPKRRILEIYLNVIEWGEGVYGADAAAQRYYSVSAVALEAEQAAHLAAIIPNPRLYDRRGMTPYIDQRAAVLLTQMNFVQVP
jgi:monofunctional glycosyltransferase